MDNISYALMSKFNWTPEQIDRLPIPIVMGLIERLNEEIKERERQERLAKKKIKMGRR